MRPARRRVAAPPKQRPLLLWDGDCHFCRRWIDRWRRITKDRVDYAPFQQLAKRFPEIPREEFAGSVQLIELDGAVRDGAEAVFRALATAPGHGHMLRIYEKLPGFAPLAEWCYGLVARHRRAASFLIRPLGSQGAERPTTFLSTWLFLRVLGLVYLVAFVSLWVQVRGLVGRGGILPAEALLEAVRAQIGPECYWRLPTLGWIGSSDGFLQLFCGGGAVLSALLVVGLAPAPVLFCLWALYLSLINLCQEFLGYQWDILLLETGFLAIFLAPLKLRSSLARDPAPSPTVLFLFRWLLFRLMFSSGAAKLLSGDPTWRHLTALRYHYETQPLPTPIGWWAHQLPGWFQAASVLVMFVAELLVPLLVFGPRRLRLIAFWALVAFQLLLAATGNYAFFNLLAIALCLLLLDDRAWPARWRKRPCLSAKQGEEQPGRRWPAWLVGAVAVGIALLSVVPMSGTLGLRGRWPAALGKFYSAAYPFYVVNPYGLFAVMTTSRPEIVVEGSADGATWLPYEFQWKPGNVRRPPRFVAPHQPRLDWQMWFAALGRWESNRWFINFVGRLLEGSPQVLRLLRRNPFPSSPPRYVRALLYEYRFTDLSGRRREGAWWKRELRGLYCPVLGTDASAAGYAAR